MPLRLPPGWHEQAAADGVWIAVREDEAPPPLLTYVRLGDASPGRAISDIAAAAAALLDALSVDHHDVVVLDAELVRCVGGRSATRTLASVIHPSGSALTVEQWSLDDRGAVQVFTALIPTARYCSVGPELRGALRSARSHGAFDASR